MKGEHFLHFGEWKKNKGKTDMTFKKWKEKDEYTLWPNKGDITIDNKGISRGSFWPQHMSNSDDAIAASFRVSSVDICRPYGRDFLHRHLI